MSGPKRDDLVYVIDEEGATFVVADLADAAKWYRQEKADGAARLRCGTLRVPEDGMTWGALADYACRRGSDRLHLFRQAGDEEFPWHWSHDDESLDYGRIETFAQAVDAVLESAQRGYAP